MSPGPGRKRLSSSRLAILAEGAFGVETAKTASSAVRYQPERVGAVIDSRFAGSTVGETLGFGGDIPIVATFAEALAAEPRPEALLVGIAPQGGQLPEAWRAVLVAALEEGLDIISGLHFFLCNDPELAALADRHGCTLFDLRKPPPDLPVGAGRAMATDAFRVLTVGTDCNTGKMTVSLELQRALRARGVRAGFAATGQTGILIAGTGIAVDAVVSDFISGAAERLTLEAARGEDGEGVDIVLVEGQGSLMHPGYSGVTHGLLHGTLPHAMILTWMPSRPRIYGGNHSWVVLPELDEVIRRYEDALAWACPDVPGRVIGVSLATYDIPEDDARAAVRHARDVTGLPATDPIRFGTDPLVEAILQAHGTHREAAAPA
ncbi:DUF1611 domain-containing protein [Candidatus Palauibacter polyketidifaciens]|uniref:DUF1611 domain-containing protein n=1 Tax=Candidatus Palauibacter polyketidifaciens TaxID=3056740 RepID=UPI002395953E|nr:DUF1611 domain-containing protein [Candidatus Palauibacter polyketidifaciens]MDE2719783.1 DUF1611 domain-containing protein [Candidatus Palauibacter polyketidifaciens]